MFSNTSTSLKFSLINTDFIFHTLCVFQQVFEVFENFVAFIVLFNYIIPISLYVGVGRYLLHCTLVMVDINFIVLKKCYLPLWVGLCCWFLLLLNSLLLILRMRSYVIDMIINSLPTLKIRIVKNILIHKRVCENISVRVTLVGRNIALQ